jgi:ammonium transporter Rh
LLTKDKLDIEIVLNATLAGGVVQGASADLIEWPFASMIVGFIVGCVSALGFAYLGPYLREKINLHDTCGVHNLHAMPGTIGGCLSAICANKRQVVNFYGRYSEFFIATVVGRTPAQQAGMQMAGVGLSIGLGITGGVLAGFIASRSFF